MKTRQGRPSSPAVARLSISQQRYQGSGGGEGGEGEGGEDGDGGGKGGGEGGVGVKKGCERRRKEGREDGKGRQEGE